jgi:small-conductance mechanosensitive channel
MDPRAYLSERFAHGFLGNSWENWAASASFTAGIFLALLVVKSVAAGRLQKLAARNHGKQAWADALRISLERTSVLFLLVFAVHFGTQSLELPHHLGRAKECLFFLFFFYQGGIWLSTTLHFFGDGYLRGLRLREPARATTMSTLILFGDVGIWVTTFLLLLANFGVNVSALLAGLGVGGVAVAFALQSILGDLFASFSIMLDKPFVIGDAIDVNGLSGSVEHIGLKTTRIRSLTGEQLIFSNSDLLKNVVRNYKRMDRRRVTFVFGLVYETPPALLDRARALVKEAVETRKDATFDRCHLARVGASSLDYEVVYWMETSDYNAYVNTHHALSVKMIELFAREGLEFAYPHVVQLPKAPAHAHA